MECMYNDFTYTNLHSSGYGRTCQPAWRVMPIARTVSDINRFSRNVNWQYTKCILAEYTLYITDKIA